ncbi:uncharacterized protein LOC132611960 [Lycium barbarum]|uniref:uncharacterized protein LOC132611960 n=1 Tax=Lycium barbarum TaxID=112863 RepID=UPI00293EF50B|nr:uncharacterized protein LOC132611960 [Lycium barbarum]
MDTEQQVTIKILFQESGRQLISTMVYAKCESAARLELWDSIYFLASSMNLPRKVGGDFNVILNEEEKIGGLPVYPSKYEDFAFCVNSCELGEVEFRGSPFTWWNGRAGQDCIFKRLDRILVNQQYRDWFTNLSIEHLSRKGLDHAPLLLSVGEQVQQFQKHFRFLKFWLDHESFMDAVDQHWRTEFIGDPFITFTLKMKSLKVALSRWSIQWNLDGDRNTRYFHSIVKGRRKRLLLTRIQNADGEWVDNVDDIATEAISFYQNQFSQESGRVDSNLLDHIPERISED